MPPLALLDAECGPARAHGFVLSRSSSASVLYRTRVATKDFGWQECFSGSAMATRCMLASGKMGFPLDIANHTVPADKKNFLDLLTPAGMAHIVLQEQPYNLYFGLA